MLILLRKAYRDEIDIMASAKRLGSSEFIVRHTILVFLNLTAIYMFDVVFPAIWVATYALNSLGARWAAQRLSENRSFGLYVLTLGFYSTRMLAYRTMILYLWFHPEAAAQFPAMCMVMAGILFSVSQGTQARSCSIIQGVGDSATLLIIAVDFLILGQTSPEALIAGLCVIGVLLYHGTILRETQRNRSEAQNLEERIRQSQKMEAVGRLTGGVAHDFNNILTVVMGNLDLYSEVETEAERRDLVSKAHGAAERASILTSQLLAFSRQSPLQTQRIQTADFIIGVHALAERVLPATISLELEAPTSIWDMQVDKNQLEVALLNLIINARDAMPKGGVLKLSADNYDPAHDPRALDAGGRFIALDLIDEGEGIPPEYIERVFEPFFTTKPVGKGSGLGLSMVKGFVEQSGGELQISSKKDEGTQVCMLIPAAVDATNSA